VQDKRKAKTAILAEDSQPSQGQRSGSIRE